MTPVDIFYKAQFENVATSDENAWRLPEEHSGGMLEVYHASENVTHNDWVIGCWDVLAVFPEVQNGRPLHPMAQAELANAFICLAQQGLRVAIITQSDYLMNALRVGVRQKYLYADQLVFLFGDVQTYTGDKSVTVSIRTVDQDGRFADTNPTGFMDTHRALMRMLI